MSLLIKTLLYPKPFSLFGPRTIVIRHFSLLSIFRRTRSGSNPARPETQKTKPVPATKSRKPLDILFKEAVGICPKPESESSDENGGDGEENAVKRGLRDLERELRVLRAKELENSEENRYKPLFTNRVRPGCDNPMGFKEISADMKLFVRHLHKGGYLNNAYFFTKNSGVDDGLDFGCFDNEFGRGFIKFAAERFGKDKQEIAKWLSGSNLKTVALSGCPSLGKRSIFAAKRLRKFLEIQEDAVCSKCALKKSCKFANQNVWKKNNKKLALIDVLNVVIVYDLDSVPPEVAVPDEVKASVSRLLNEIVKLSQTTS